MIEGVETMGQNLTCFMNIKILLIILATSIVAKVGLDALNYSGFFMIVVDNAIPIYFVIAIIIDQYDIGRLSIKCILFDFIIAFMLYAIGYWVGIVIVAYLLDLIIGFFKYIVF
jgi:hypothetical protein